MIGAVVTAYGIVMMLCSIGIGFTVGNYRTPARQDSDQPAKGEE